MIDDGIGHLRVIRQTLHALDRTCEDLLALEGLNQVKQVIAQPVRIRFHRPLGVDGYHPLAAPARHAEFLGLPSIRLLLLRMLCGRVLSPFLRLCRLLTGGAPAPGGGRRLGVSFSRVISRSLGRVIISQFRFKLSLWTRCRLSIKGLALAGNFSRFQVSMGTGIRVGRFQVSLGRKSLLARLGLVIRVPFRVSLGKSSLAAGVFARFQVSMGCVGVQGVGGSQFQICHAGIVHLTRRRFRVGLGDGIRLSPSGFRLCSGSLFLDLFLGSCHGMISSFG